MFNDLKDSINLGSFHIIHLNINSIFNKFEHIFDILDKTDADILALKEIKLDNSIPNNPFIDVNKRKNRSRRSDWIMVYVKKCYRLSEITITESWKIIFLKIKINKTVNNFIFAFKPPSKDDVEFIENLETIMFNMNLTHDFFIIGDLNNVM